VKVGESPLDRQRRPRGTLGVVLVRERIAERRHQPVAELFGPQESDLCALRRDALQSRPASRPLGAGASAQTVARSAAAREEVNSSPQECNRSPTAAIPSPGSTSERRTGLSTRWHRYDGDLPTSPRQPIRAARASPARGTCPCVLRSEVRDCHDQFVLTDRRRNFVANSAVPNNQQPMTDSEQFFGL
jgi:hypothetical protein